MPDTISPKPTRQRRELVLLAIALVLSMSPWFSTAAVLGQLRVELELTGAQGSWLTIVVQIGFVIGAVVSAVTNLADRIAPRRLILLGSFGAALANLVVVLSGSFGLTLFARLATGASLAAVYPPSLKAMSSWYRQGRGFALGVMVGALTLGSALPHLLNAAGGVEWQLTLVAVSILSATGGLVADRLCLDGPFSVPAAVFDPRQLRAIVANREFRLASIGYFGHMWELYAMWAWIAAFYGDVFDSSRKASAAAFSVIGIGAAGCVYAGMMSDRRSRSEAAALAMRWSGASAVATGFLVNAPVPVVVASGLFWGFWVVADSAQFSAIVTEVTDARYRGTALTMQLATGFILTVFTIFLVPVVQDTYGWGLAFLLLAPGPLLGTWAMSALKKNPVS